MRIGIGYDSHRLVEGRSLIIGGVEIPYIKGLLGHSDADVLIHAVMDAILGAISRGDIGEIFPDSKEEFRGISSLSLLEQVRNILREDGYRVVNVDCIIVAQNPKISPFKEEMRENIARILDVEVADINIKATTTEKMGFEGRGEGISSHAIALVEKINNK